MTPTDSFTQHEDAPIQPVAAILAVLFPGAGHAYLGETKRAILIACGVLGLFFGGILIGGIDVVDKKEDLVWFMGQAMVGPIAFATDYYHQKNLKVNDRSRNMPRSANPYEIRDPKTGGAIVVRNPDTGEPVEFVDPRTNLLRMGTDADQPPNSKSVGRVNELGTLFAAIAGMLNLICIIDASYRHNVRSSSVWRLRMNIASINGLANRMDAVLAWRPFLDPLDVHNSWWYFLAPMAFLIALTYRAARMRTLEKYWFAVFTMTVQIVLAMIGLVIASYLFVAVYVRFIAERAG